MAPSFLRVKTTIPYWDLEIDLFPFQSPLLWESLLVSFPPLNNMFKFGGSSYLSPALKHEQKPRALTQRTLVFDYLGTSLGMLEGRLAARFLKGCVGNPQTLLEHVSFGKRVWTRSAPTARARAAICVQRFDDSLNPAIHITYRVSRRSSSLLEPRDPSLKGGFWFVVCLFKNHRWDVGQKKFL